MCGRVFRRPAAALRGGCANGTERGTGIIHERQHPAGFPYIALEHPVKFTGTPADIRREPPLLGEHTIEVLKELGYSDADAERIAREAQDAADERQPGEGARVADEALGRARRRGSLIGGWFTLGSHAD